MPGIKELKTRIKSISSTRKITRAMQMVSAAKMRKAQNATLASRTYSSLAWELITNLASGGVILRSDSDEGSQSGNEILHSVQNDADKMAGGVTSLLQSFPKATKIGVILLTTNTGLVGSLNNNLMARVKEVSHHPASDALGTPPQAGGEKLQSSPPFQGGEPREAGGGGEVIAEIIAYGKKGKNIAKMLNKNILADFAKQDRSISTQDIFPLAQYITEIYKSGQYKKIVIVYNHFVSTLTQKATVKQLLPFASFPSLSREGGSRRLTEGLKNADAAPTTSTASQPLLLKKEEITASDYLFEPDPTAVLEHLLPRIIESQIYQAILESNASEHSARMVMMKNATEAAGDLISDLTLTYNQLRQNKITTELAEITAGRIALE